MGLLSSPTTFYAHLHQKSLLSEGRPDPFCLVTIALVTATHEDYLLTCLGSECAVWLDLTSPGRQLI